MPWDRKRLLGYVKIIRLILGVTDKTQNGDQTQQKQSTIVSKITKGHQPWPYSELWQMLALAVLAFLSEDDNKIKREIKRAQYNLLKSVLYVTEMRQVNVLMSNCTSEIDGFIKWLKLFDWYT